MSTQELALLMMLSGSLCIARYGGKALYSEGGSVWLEESVY